MDTIETTRVFLGWCSAINIGLLMLSGILVSLLRGPISRIHARMFHLDDRDLARAYFQYLAQYKIAVIVFNIVPYFALRMMG